MLNGSQTGFGRTALIERGECMPSIDTFLQTAYQFIKALFVRVTKRMYRGRIDDGGSGCDGDSI